MDETLDAVCLAFLFCVCLAIVWSHFAFAVMASIDSTDNEFYCAYPLDTVLWYHWLVLILRFLSNFFDKRTVCIVILLVLAEVVMFVLWISFTIMAFTTSCSVDFLRNAHVCGPLGIVVSMIHIGLTVTHSTQDN